MERAKEICPTTSMGKLNDGALLVDVREKNEVTDLAFDVKNQLFIPLSEFEERFQEVPKDREIILACDGGNRSLKATYFLMNHGYNQVFRMKDGIEKWARKEFPTKGDPIFLLDISSCCSNDTCC